MSDPMSDQLRHQAGYEGNAGRVEEAKSMPGYAEAKLLADSIPRGEMRAFGLGPTGFILFRAADGEFFGCSMQHLPQFK